MPNYRRAPIPGASYFFTVVTHRRRPVFEDLAAINALRTALRIVKLNHPFHIDAMVVLPDHVHAIWTLPGTDGDFSRRWRLVKGRVSRAIGQLPAQDVSRRRRRERTLWQRRYWEHLLRDDDDYRRHMDYIHYNPVRHGLVTSPIDWPYSSFRHLVRAGIYPADWGASEPASVAGMCFE
ncbi:putative transposase [Natronocella acetinitrilica]|uniref:Transposase n=1 Tax=Natronocella acetinitrilica TaxID=414046 RepID=A0AAE3G3G3_9GAMM|nr:transposase [Natronocella acetinitrilica]MCP1674006.1 putative transposase [Natronocella acetinitrilica]